MYLCVAYIYPCVACTSLCVRQRCMQIRWSKQMSTARCCIQVFVCHMCCIHVLTCHMCCMHVSMCCIHICMCSMHMLLCGAAVYVDAMVKADVNGEVLHKFLHLSRVLYTRIDMSHVLHACIHVLHKFPHVLHTHVHVGGSNIPMRSLGKTSTTRCCVQVFTCPTCCIHVLTCHMCCMHIFPRHMCCIQMLTHHYMYATHATYHLIRC